MDGSAAPQDLDAGLLALLGELDARGYDFVTPTPATHRRVLKRRGEARPGDLRDILGWGRLFDPSDAPAFLVEALAAADLLERRDGPAKSRVRVSRVNGRLYLHSAFPTEAQDAVFLGPDSYRFADFILRHIPPAVSQALDVGGGAGVGALTVAGAAPAAKVALSDVNPSALRLARVNAAHAGLTITLQQASGVMAAHAGLDLIVANPPYMADADQTYRDGGDMHGAALSVEWAAAGLAKLRPGGRMLLYSGSAICEGGRDELRDALAEVAEQGGGRLTYAELDPDVFGEELETPAYGDVERIAVVGAVIIRER
ncbi:methyltransferase [Phenylobacterium sp.]|jgi:methylase of polypeptide subunit release factors|uniref:methyltransferase n=1 Tax=Phenylobacterium sp. TaxID=1871053 RepID=UPI003784E1EC